jgi:transposase InsO family protein
MEQHDLVNLIAEAVAQANAGLIEQVNQLQQQVQQANAAVAAIAEGGVGGGQEQEQPGGGGEALGGGEGKAEEPAAVSAHHGSSWSTSALQKTLQKPKLKAGDQFPIYERKLMIYLSCFDAADLLQPDYQDPEVLTEAQQIALTRKKHVVRGILYESVDDKFISILQAHDDKRSPLPMWQGLCNVFKGNSQLALKLLQNDLANLDMKKDPNMSLLDLINKIDYITNQLAVNGIATSEYQKRTTLTRALHSRYNTMVSIMELLPDKSYQDTCKAVIDFHKRHFGYPHEVPGTASARPGGALPRALLVQDERTCYTCGQTGHIKRDCPTTDSKPPATGQQNKRCNYCGRHRHLESECRAKASGKPRTLLCGWCKKPGHREEDCHGKANGIPRANLTSTIDAVIPATDLWAPTTDPLAFMVTSEDGDHDDGAYDDLPDLVDSNEQLDQVTDLLLGRVAIPEVDSDPFNPFTALDSIIAGTSDAEYIAQVYRATVTTLNFPDDTVSFTTAGATTTAAHSGYVHPVAVEPTALTATIPLGVWVLDSGANRHFSNSTEGLTDFRRERLPPVRVAGSNNTTLAAVGTGSKHGFGRAIVVPGLRHSLLSTAQLWRDKRWHCTFSDHVEIADEQGNIKGTGTLHPSGLYILDEPSLGSLRSASTCKPPERKRDDKEDGEEDDEALATTALLVTHDDLCAHLTTELSPLVQAHYKWGHVGIGKLRHLFNQGLLPGVTATAIRDGLPTCMACLSAKHHRQALSNSTDSKPLATRKGERVHTDTMGPMEVPTVGGARYAHCFLDEATGLAATYLTVVKDGTPGLETYQKEVLHPEGLRLGTLISDGGGEFTSDKFTSWCKEQGIRQEITPRHSPYLNGRAERLNLTLVSIASAQLHHAGLEKDWWGPAIKHATFVYNRIPHSTYGNVCPYTNWTGRPVDPQTMIPFGVKTYVHVPAEHRTKFDSKSVTGIYVGRDRMKGGAKVWLPPRQTAGGTVQGSLIHTRDFIVERDAAITREFFINGNAHLNLDPPPLPSASLPTAPSITNPITIPKHRVRKLSNNQLRTALRACGLPISGKKAIMQARLEEHIQLNSIQTPAAAVPPAAEEQAPVAAPDPVPIADNSTNADDLAAAAAPPAGTMATESTANTATVVATTTGTTSAALPAASATTAATGSAASAAASAAVSAAASAAASLAASTASAATGPAASTAAVPAGPFDRGRGSELLSTAGGEPQTSVTSTSHSDLALMAAIQAREETLFWEGYALLTTDASVAAAHAERRSTSAVLARHIPVPNNYDEAMSSGYSAQWSKAISKELNSLNENSVYTVVDRPPDQPVLGGRYTFKVKETATGLVSRFKARFVAKGFLQEIYVNYNITYSPVCRAVSVRCIWARSMSMGWRTYSADVTTAFLYAPLMEEVYVEAPKGSNTPAGKCWQLHRCLYGLRQSPSSWAREVTKAMTSIGFTISTADPCVFLRRNGESELDCIIAVYVDDVLLSVSNESVYLAVSEQLERLYKMTREGELTWYLGMKITRTREAMTVSQELYTVTILERMNMQDCNPAPTPATTDLPSADDCPSTPEEKAAMRDIPYRSALGMLLYLSVCTRGDIMYIVSRLAKYVSNPGIKHWQALKRVLRYLRGTTKYGLRYLRAGSMTTFAYCDASFADADVRRHSTVGYIYYLSGGPISWTSYVLRSIATSTTEAEYCALSDCVKEGLWIRRLLLELDAPQPTTILHEDNTGAVALSDAQPGQQHRRSRHIDLRYNLTREQVLGGAFRVIHCPSTRMIADLLTKPLARELLERLVQLMGIGKV